LNAGKNGSLGSVDTMVSIPLGPAYLVAAVLFNKSPIDVNESLLSHFGLGDQYRVALADPYYTAGRWGGSGAATYISLAIFVKGLPQGIRLGNIRPDINGTGTLVLTVEGISVVGGNGQLVFVGSAGAASSVITMMSGRGGQSGGGNQGRYTTDMNYAMKQLGLNKAEFNRAIHAAKQFVEGNPDMMFDLQTGNIIDQRSGEVVGNLLDYKNK
jgi:hypothetical protein